uniref:Uncharacterized protein n=1 Tax=Knipowitschia caucasica TaxID=637954 RepID=A0AAV2L9Q9_KNICA
MSELAPDTTATAAVGLSSAPHDLQGLLKQFHGVTWDERVPGHRCLRCSHRSAVQVWASWCPVSRCVSIISPPQACPHTDPHKDLSTHMTATQRQHRWMPIPQPHRHSCKEFWEKKLIYI